MAERFAFILIMIVVGISGWHWFGNISNDKAELAIISEEAPAKPIKVKLTSAIKAIKIEGVNSAAIEMPKEIRAVYATAQTAANPSKINNIISLIESTELNSVVVNVKDGDNVFLNQWMVNLIKRLREKNIYPIARMVLFQDNHTAQIRPDLALKNPDGSLWGKSGYHWVDPASKEVWDYNAEVAIKALDMGFKEINFDYVRFPDGNIDDIVYPFYKYDRFKKDIINEAASYINGKIRQAHPEALISLDIFAYSFLRTNDIGVGQKLVELADYFDTMAPMVYPSHYLSGNFGFDNPAEHPYEVVRQTLSAGRAQFEAAGKQITIRPWIQDFNMGAVYDREKIQAQITAVKDALGHGGWMSWNPNNVYLINKYE